MNNVNDWYIFLNVITEDICKKIIDTLGDWESGTVGRKSGEISDEERLTGFEFDHGLDKDVRRSQIKWSSEQWIYDLIWPYMEEANVNAGWKYDVLNAEPMQITKYKPSGYYNFHKDGRGDFISRYNTPDNGYFHGNVRKLSMTVLLNDDYEGGHFEISTVDKGESLITKPELKGTGSILVFPSYMEHRITEITKGIRYSLVAWFLGAPFR